MFQQLFNKRFSTVHDIWQHLSIDLLVVIMKGGVPNMDEFPCFLLVQVDFECWSFLCRFVLTKVVDVHATMFFYELNGFVEFLKRIVF